MTKNFYPKRSGYNLAGVLGNFASFSCCKAFYIVFNLKFVHIFTLNNRYRSLIRLNVMQHVNYGCCYLELGRLFAIPVLFPLVYNTKIYCTDLTSPLLITIPVWRYKSQTYAFIRMVAIFPGVTRA